MCRSGPACLACSCSNLCGSCCERFGKLCEERGTRKSSSVWPQTHLVQGALRMLLNDLLQHPPVCARGELGDAAAALQVQLVHLLGDVVTQHGAAAPDVPLKGTDRRT